MAEVRPLSVRRTASDRRARIELVAELRPVHLDGGAVRAVERATPEEVERRLVELRRGVEPEPCLLLAEDIRPLLESGRIEEAARALASRPLLLVAGHDAYEAALADGRAAPVVIADLADPGLAPRPLHRVLTAGVAVTGGDPAGSLAELLQAIRGRVAAGTYRDGGFQLLPLEGEAAVVELHRQVIDNILGRRRPEDHLIYTGDPEEAVRLVDSGAGVAAFFVDAPDARAVWELARLGKTMPRRACCWTGSAIQPVGT